MESPEQLLAGAQDAIRQAATLAELEQLRVSLLGKKGAVTERLKALGSATPEERKTLGALLNQAKQGIATAIESKQAELERAEMDTRLQSEQIDITLPAAATAKGSIHPITQVLEELTAIFADFGFAVMEGPEIEDDFHNFTALNFPPDHPARLMHDTFFLNGKDDKGNPLVLRTHTSPVQIRTMLEQKPPIRIIAPGATFRCDSDMTHTPMFHQVEGLVIDKGIHMGYLKGMLQQFIDAFFGREGIPMRFRPSFFPFTEPSAEVDIGCQKGREQLLIGEGSDWMEILGCGMVHPNVIRNCGLDPEEWQGFAFGVGVERLAMLKYNIPDLRTFFESDLRWLKHYGFRMLDMPNLATGLSS